MNRTLIVKVTFLVVAFVGLVSLLAHSPLPFVDWIAYWRRVATDHMANPYALRGIMNPPWTYLITYPFTFLPVRYDAALFVVVSVIIIYQYLGRDMARFACVATSAAFFALINSAQLEALIIWGMMTRWGLPLIVIKPQAAIFTGLLKLNRQSLGLLIVALLGSFMIWGFWPQQALNGRILTAFALNESFFPYGLPFIPLLLFLGLYWRSYALLCLASLCLSPYWVINSALPFVVAFVRETKAPVLWVLMSILTWVFVLT